MNEGPLARLFNFDEGDLFANRNGYLSDQQQARLTREAQDKKKFGRYGGIFLLTFAIVPFAGAFVLWGVWAVAAAAWPIVWGLLGVIALRSSLSTRSFEVKKVEGPVNIVKVVHSSSGDESSYDEQELHIGGTEFDIDEEGLADCMMQGDTYAVYYLEDPVQILSAERLASAQLPSSPAPAADQASGEDARA